MRILKINGFTLLELMLVIIIMSIIATLGIAIYQQRLQNAKVEQTALQIQQLLQAGSSYYIDKNVWPNSAQVPPDFQPYLPIEIPQTPWGGNYQYQPTADNLKFQVIAKSVPSEEIADRIIVRLPGGIKQNCIPNGPCDVLAEVAIPGRKQLPSNYQITGVGTTTAFFSGSTITQTVNTSNAFIPSFTCPMGWIPQVEGGISGIYPVLTTSAEFEYCPRVYNQPITQVTISNKACTSTPPYSCSFSVTATMEPGFASNFCFTSDRQQGLGPVDVSLITYCCKPTSPNSNQCMPPS